ncbi:caffeic acid 3-o-methyltransferase [Quercus suber]|uniref:Caffeic acid 3-o-methyltransferase n=1 Tax=Quercus suber TaxID=58331 RepID=A0AAW0KIU5_QUESU
MENESTENRNQARIAIMELAHMISVPMSLNAVVRLNVADAIWQDPDTCPPRGHQGDPENLQRILRMLTSYGVFAEHVSKTPDSDTSERQYSLTEVGKTLVTDSEGLSYASYVLQHHQDELMRAWPLVHEAVVDPTLEPFVKVNGEPAYSYYGKRPEMNGLMVKAMSGASVPFMKAFLDVYDGFDGVTQ